jgi:hypothetical protein
VVAYDSVTVGGFGLASVSLERHVVRADEQPGPGTPPGVPVPGTGPSAPTVPVPPTGPTTGPATGPASTPPVSRSGRRRSPRSPSRPAG